MNYKLFGKSGLRVSELALETMTFGEEWTKESFLTEKIILRTLRNVKYVIKNLWLTKK